VDGHCRELFLKAEARRLGKTIMFLKGNGPIIYSDSSEDEKSTEDEMKGLKPQIGKADAFEVKDGTEHAIKRLKVA